MHAKTGDAVLDERYRMSLIYSIIEGSFFALMMGFGEYYFGAYAILLGATSFQMGLFGSLPHFLGLSAQLLSSKVISLFQSRKKMMILFSLLRTILWIPLMLAFSFGTNRVWIFIILVSTYFITNYFQFPAWTSWMGDLVNEAERPTYFGKRNSISTFLSLIGITFAGFFLEFMKGHPEYNPAIGFIALFILSLFSSAMALTFVALKTDIEYHERKEDKFSLKFFMKKITKNSFGRFTIFNTVFFFGVFISAPFFIPFQLKNLNFTYIEYMFGLIVFFIAKSVFFKIWGAITAKYGNSKPLFISIAVLSSMPIVWGFFVSLPWHVYLLEVFAGMGWAGYELLSFNYIYETVEPSKRARSTSYQGFLKGCAMFAGGMVGSLLMVKTESYLLVFLMSVIFRIVAVTYMIWNKDALKDLEPVSYKKLIFELVSRVPREGRNALVIGIKTAKTRLSVMTDQSSKFDEDGTIIPVKKR